MKTKVEQSMDQPVDWEAHLAPCLKNVRKTRTKYCRPLRKGRAHKGRARHKLRTEPRIFLNEFALACLIVLAPTTLLKMPIILVLASTSTKKPTTTTTKTTTSTYAAAAIDTAASNFAIHINNVDDEDGEQFVFKTN